MKNKEQLPWAYRALNGFFASILAFSLAMYEPMPPVDATSEVSASTKTSTTYPTLRDIPCETFYDIITQAQKEAAQPEPIATATTEPTEPTPTPTPEINTATAPSVDYSAPTNPDYFVNMAGAVAVTAASPTNHIEEAPEISWLLPGINRMTVPRPQLPLYHLAQPITTTVATGQDTNIVYSREKITILTGDTGAPPLTNPFFAQYNSHYFQGPNLYRAVYENIEDCDSVDGHRHMTGEMSEVYGKKEHALWSPEELLPEQLPFEYFILSVLNNYNGGSWVALEKAFYLAGALQVDIAAFSVGGILKNPDVQKKMEKAVKYATDNGVLVVLAVGNDISPDFYPSCINNPYLIRTGATELVNNKVILWPGTNTNCMENEGFSIFLPGRGILMQDLDGSTLKTGATSFTQPIETALAAITMVRPDGSKATREEVLDHLQTLSKPFIYTEYTDPQKVEHQGIQLWLDFCIAYGMCNAAYLPAIAK